MQMCGILLHRESKTPNFIQSRIFENPTVIRSNFAQFAPNNVLKGINFGYFLGFSIIYRIKSRSNAKKYPIMSRILSNQVIGYFLERDWIFGRSIFAERIFFGVFGSLCTARVRTDVLARVRTCVWHARHPTGITRGHLDFRTRAHMREIRNDRSKTNWYLEGI